MNKHSEAINQFLVENPTWMKCGLRKEVNKSLPKEEDSDFDVLGYIPKAFEIDEKNKTLRVLEIEDKSEITIKRLKQIANFEDKITSQCCGWVLELHVIKLRTGNLTVWGPHDFFLFAMECNEALRLGYEHMMWRIKDGRE